MEDLLKLRKVRDKQDTVLTIIIYDHSKEQFITFLKITHKIILEP